MLGLGRLLREELGITYASMFLTDRRLFPKGQINLLCPCQVLIFLAFASAINPKGGWVKVKARPEIQWMASKILTVNLDKAKLEKVKAIRS
jgi:hypothetical protein